MTGTIHWLDLSLVLIYFAAVLLLGLVLRGRASTSIESYFLGNKRMSWWLLGASGMASNVDMAGTMLIASLILVFGVQGFWIELRGGVVLIMAFYLALMGKWTRRSECMTVSEWMEFRFGTGPQGRWPRLLSAVGNIVFFTWAIAFFAAGSAKFLAVFLPWNPNVSSAGLILIVLFYTALSGLHGVVWMDVLQGGLILLMAGYFSVRSFIMVDSAFVARTVGESWMSLVPRWEINPPAGYEGFRLLGLGIIFYMVKTTIDGLSGAGGYMAQRYFAARDERECRRMSLFWIVLMSARWPMVMGIAMLGLTVRHKLVDPELVVPMVVRDLVPVGLRGLMIVALLAAAMSTYSSVMNAGASYFVKDVYQGFLRPRASQRELVRVSILSTIAFVLIGLAMALGLPQVNDLWSYLNMGLGVGLLVPNFLRWYWWRFNGYGYSAGVGAGMAAALMQRAAWPRAPEYAMFSAIAAISLLAMVVVSLLTPPIEAGVLRHFYLRTRPFGWWGPVRAGLDMVTVTSIRRENRRDLLALSLAVPWQIVLFLLPMTIVMKQWPAAGGLAVVLAMLSAVLRAVWMRSDRESPELPTR